MKPRQLHHEIVRAKAVQKDLRDRVKVTSLRKKTRYVAGVDAAFTKKHIIAVACLYRLQPLLQPLEDSQVVLKITFPYIPGLLSFREGPALTEAVERLSRKPDVLLFDGQGIAHPLELGIASHIGLLLGIPSIGCAKSRLIGEYREPGELRGNYSMLIYEGKTVGAVTRTRDNVKPLFISPGHLVNLGNSIEIAMKCLDKYRIPEPLRRAHSLAGRRKKSFAKE